MPDLLKKNQLMNIKKAQGVKRNAQGKKTLTLINSKLCALRFTH